LNVLSFILPLIPIASHPKLTPYTMRLIVEILECEEITIEEILQLDLISTVNAPLFLTYIFLDIKEYNALLDQRIGLVFRGFIEDVAFYLLENI